MNIKDLINDVILLSGRDDLEDNKNVVLGWLNRYKLYLQRSKRISFSDNTSDITLVKNQRVSDLPSDFLYPVCITRNRDGEVGVSIDSSGNQSSVDKNVVLTRWLDRVAFLNRYPNQRSAGELNTGTVNNYTVIGRSIHWGPIPDANEILNIYYYRLLPRYDLTNHTEDDFTTLFEDGLFAAAMENVFKGWIPDKEKEATWRADRLIAEVSLKKYQVGFEHPMEETLDLPDN